MDYLDPRKRRYYNLRLVIGYVLVAIVIGLATVIVVYGANGYGINTKTGQIVENGLLFVDSQPGSAEVYLNGQDRHTTTSARLILPAGNYTLTLKKDGYRDWSRKFTLDGQSVARYVYPFLFPAEPQAKSLKSYKTFPGLISQSPSRRWLLVQDNSASAQKPVFDEYDMTTLDKPSPAVQKISLPAGSLSDYSSSSKLTAVEWSSDNNSLLLKHTYRAGTEFLLFNRLHPDQSFNLNKLFKSSPTDVSLYNKSISQVYLYDAAAGSLRLGNPSDGKLGPVLLTDVLAYKPYGKNLITYVTGSREPAGQVAARIWDSGQSYPLYEFAAGRHYIIDAAQFQGHFYYIAGSDKADRFNLYKDPLNDLKDPAVGKALALLSLQEPGAAIGGFSDNARFIGLENGQNFEVYDIETDSAYQYTVKPSLAGPLDWMDGHRYLGESGGKILAMDYDGTNLQQLTDTSLAAGGFFSGDYHHLLTIAPGKTGVALQDIDMRAGADLPAK